MRRTSGAVAPWRVQDDGGPIELAVSGPLVVNDFPTMLGAALGGVGLAQVPEPIAVEDLYEGRLDEVLAAYAPMTPGVFLYHSGLCQVLPKLRAFIDHVREHPADVANLSRRADPTELNLGTIAPVVNGQSGARTSFCRDAPQYPESESAGPNSNSGEASGRLGPVQSADNN